MKQTEEIRAALEEEMERYGVPPNSTLAIMAEQGIRQLESFIRDTENMSRMLEEHKKARKEHGVWVPMSLPKTGLS